MRSAALRIIIAIICFVLFIYVTPLLFSVLGLPLGGDVFQLIKICAAIVALFYVIWGPTPPL